MGQGFLMGQHNIVIRYATGSFLGNSNFRVGCGFGHAITGLAFTPRIVSIGPYDQFADFAHPSKTQIDVTNLNDIVISIRNLQGETNTLPAGFSHATTTINGILYVYANSFGSSGVGLQQLVDGFSMIMPATHNITYSWYAAT